MIGFWSNVHHRKFVDASSQIYLKKERNVTAISVILIPEYGQSNVILILSLRLVVFQAIGSYCEATSINILWQFVIHLDYEI